MITIKDADLNTFEVAEIGQVGELAAHASLNESGYTITHIRTGGAVIRGLTEEQALKALPRFAELDWSKLKTHRSRKALDELGPQVRNIAKELGL